MQEVADAVVEQLGGVKVGYASGDEITDEKLRRENEKGTLDIYDPNTGEIRQGILMSDNFDPKGLTSKTPISSKKGDLKYRGDKVVSADGDVTVKVTNDWDWNERRYNTLELIVPKSKKRGEKYFNDEVLLSLMDGQFEGSSSMKAEFKRSNLDAVMKRLDELGVTVERAKEEQEDNHSGRRFYGTAWCMGRDSGNGQTPTRPQLRLGYQSAVLPRQHPQPVARQEAWHDARRHRPFLPTRPDVVP